jgi:FkbM family methyltransferase
MNDWFKDDGDNTLRINYNLDETSLVVDLGGYEGKFSQKIYDVYNCNIICFEPCSHFFEKIKMRFHGIDKIKIYNSGVGNLTETKVLYRCEDSTSFYCKVGDHSESSNIISFDSFVKNIKKIDLLKINIEGGEYDLLDHIIQNDLQEKIINIQVQFHRNIKNCEVRRKNIQELLKKTHALTYNYDFIWENWHKL